jgi:serine/threonine protein kinase
VYQLTGHVDTTSDIYSLGVLLLELLSGRPLHESRVDVAKVAAGRVPISDIAEDCLLGAADSAAEPGNAAGSDSGSTTESGGSGRAASPMAMSAPQLLRRALDGFYGLAVECLAPARARRPSAQGVGDKLARILEDADIGEELGAGGCRLGNLYENVARRVVEGLCAKEYVLSF